MEPAAIESSPPKKTPKSPNHRHTYMAVEELWQSLLVSVFEAAHLSGLPVWEIRKACQADALLHDRTTNTIRISTADLRRYVTERLNGGKK